MALLTLMKNLLIVYMYVYVLKNITMYNIILTYCVVYSNKTHLQFRKSIINAETKDIAQYRI